MNHEIANQIARLINTQNELTVLYTADRVLQNASDYIYRLGDGDKVLGAVEVRRVQWYQWEIDHLSVDPSETRKGIGSLLVDCAEARAKQLGARIAQCTIRLGNVASERVFKKRGFAPTVTFTNQDSANSVTVYQKPLTTT